MLPDEYITDADSYVTFKNAIEAVPLILTLPLIVCVPVNVLLPVVAKYELEYPFNRLAFAAYEALSVTIPVNCDPSPANEPVNDPVAITEKEPDSFKESIILVTCSA